MGVHLAPFRPNSKAVTSVLVSRSVEKQLFRLPKHIRKSLHGWVREVELLGIRKARQYPGYHDEPLLGDRFGQRSVRLNRAYRAIYIERIEGIQLIVIEVSKHAY